MQPDYLLIGIIQPGNPIEVHHNVAYINDGEEDTQNDICINWYKKLSMKKATGWLVVKILSNDYIFEQARIQHEGTCTSGGWKPRTVIPRMFDKSKIDAIEEKVLKETGMSLSNLGILRGLFHNFNESIEEMDEKSPQYCICFNLRTRSFHLVNSIAGIVNYAISSGADLTLSNNLQEVFMSIFFLIQHSFHDYQNGKSHL
jgi:hypothetical protein